MNKKYIKILILLALIIFSILNLQYKNKTYSKEIENIIIKESKIAKEKININFNAEVIKDEIKETKENEVNDENNKIDNMQSNKVNKPKINNKTISKQQNKILEEKTEEQSGVEQELEESNQKDTFKEIGEMKKIYEEKESNEQPKSNNSLLNKILEEKPIINLDNQNLKEGKNEQS